MAQQLGKKIKKKNTLSHGSLTADAIRLIFSVGRLTSDAYDLPKNHDFKQRHID